MAKRKKKRNPEKPTPKEIRHQRRTREERRKLLFAGGGVIALIVLILVFGYYRENIAVARAPIAVVNGQEISTNAYQERVRYQQFNLITNFGNQIDQQTLVNFLQNQLPQSTLDTMIDEVLIAQRAAEEDIAVTEQEVQAEIERQFGFTGEGAPTPTPPAGSEITTTTGSTVTREEFNQAYANFIESLETQFSVSESRYREIIRKQLLRDKVRELVTADVSDTEEQVHARHILVETEEEAQQVRERLMTGEDFATVAQEVSTDTQTAEQGGDLGWFGRGNMVAEFEEVAFSLPPGEISEPVETQFGFHIIEVLEKDPNRQLSPSELDQARQQRFSEWLQEQRASADIQRLWSPEDAPPLPEGLTAAQQPAPPTMATHTPAP